jgi:glycosyltransferase involved in cell wall biosynthesis
MKIGIVIQNNYPVDREVRTRKFAETLSGQYEEVIILCRNSRTNPDRGVTKEEYDLKREKVENATIVRYSWFQSTPLFGLATAPIPFNPLWLLWLVINFKREELDVAIGSELRAGPLTVFAGGLLGIPVITDLRENHSELAKILPKDTVLDYVIRNPYLVVLIERFLYRFSDHLWVVADERRRVMPDHIAHSSRVSVVGNVPDSNISADALSSSRRFDWERFTLVYVGFIDEFRGLDTVIEALEKIENPETGIHLAIAGNGEYKSKLEEKAVALGVEDDVTFLGWVDSKDVPAFLASGDIGVIPHHVNGHIDSTIPNKLFDMMGAGLPILSTNATPIVEILSETNCGVIVGDDWKPERIAEAIISMKKSTILEQMGENARAAVENEYNWEQESKTIIETVEELV